MGWLFKSKEQKEAEAKQKEIEANNARINNQLSDDPYLGSKSKEINANKMKIQQSQDAARTDVEEELTSLMRMANQEFEDEDTVDSIRDLINLTRKMDLGLNAGTTSTVKIFILKQIGNAKNACLSKNQSALDGLVGGLNNLLLDMSNERKKKFFADPTYVDTRAALFDLQANMKELASQERLAKANIKKLGLKLQKDKDYMTAAEWRNEQVNYANTLKDIENQRTEIQRRIDLAQKQVSELETSMRTQAVFSDQDLLRNQEKIMRQKEQREDVSADIDSAIDDLSHRNSHVSNANMGMQDLGISNQKVDDNELADFLNNL